MAEGPAWLRRAWLAALLLAVASRVWNALAMPVMRGYDATGHVSYALFLDLYRTVPHADQGWSYFHPPLHYLFGWALAQAGSAEVLVRGLALLASGASLLTAVFAAYAVRLGVPRQPGAAIVAFLAVAFLPVHVYSSTMPGNELTSAALGSLVIALFLRNQTRDRPTLAGDAAVGLAAGLALLSKFSGLIPLVVVLAALGLLAVSRPGNSLPRTVLRGGVIAAIAVLVCLPYYARNLMEFGTPFQLSRDFSLVASVEDVQPPGARGWRDLVVFPLRAFLDPDPEKDHLLHSIWGSVYVNTWSDARPGVERPLARTLVFAGLTPTLLALLGFAACLRSAFRERRPVELTLVLLAGAGIGALLIMVYRVPTFAMLKASYLLSISLAYGFFVARAIVALVGRPRLAAPALLLLVLACGFSAIASTPGLLRPWGGENERMAGVHAYFGDYERAEAIYRGRIPEMKRPARRTWMRENLAGVLLESGNPEEARTIYDKRQRIFGAPPHLEELTSPWLINRHAVATALAGDLPAARALLDKALVRGAESPLLLNRAAVRALEGDLAGAEVDVAAAFELEPELAAALRVRAWLEAERGETQQAEHTRDEAERRSRAAPRGFPYGVGNGFHLNGQRFLLVIEAGKLELYRAARARSRP